MCYECIKENIKLIGLLFFFLVLLLLLSTSNIKADSYSQDIVGFGTCNSDVTINGLKDNMRTENGEFAIGRQFKIEGDDSYLFSGFQVENGTKTSFISSGNLGNLSHSINIRDATDLYATSEYLVEGRTVQDSVDETVSTFISGQSILNLTFINGTSQEKVRGVTFRNCKGLSPDFVSTTDLNGTFTIRSEVST